MWDLSIFFVFLKAYKNGQKLTEMDSKTDLILCCIKDLNLKLYSIKKDGTLLL